VKESQAIDKNKGNRYFTWAIDLSHKTHSQISTLN